MPLNMDVVVKTLRSVLNTTKYGLLEWQLRDIYREMEGDDIPYKEFHFTTLYDFLCASNEFCLSKSRDGLFIRARPKDHSKHIVNMVSEQRMKKTKFRKRRPSQTTHLAGKQRQKRGHNTKTQQHRSKWKFISKAKIKATNRMKMARGIGQNRQMNAIRVQADERSGSMLTAQNSINVHFWLRSFFKQVQFLLKQIASNTILYDENHIECFNELAKICVWKEIAHDYRGLCVQDDASEDAGHSENGSSLECMQNSVQRQLGAVIENVRLCSIFDYAARLNCSEINIAMDSPEQDEVPDHGLVDFMQNVAFILECIVANPILYEYKNQLHRNESIKFSIWNHICTVYYRKIQSNDFELQDEDAQFEIKYLQRTIERYLNRMTKPLTLSMVTP